MVKQEKSKREIVLERIARDPLTTLDCGHIVRISRGDSLFFETGGSREIVSKPDLILESFEGEVYVIGVTEDDDEEKRETARLNIGGAVWWHGKHRPEIPAGRIYTYLISPGDPKYAKLFE